MKFRPRLLAVALGTTFAFAQLPLAAAPQAEQGAPQAEPSRSLYWQGHEALGRSDWRAALGHFKALEKELAAGKTEPADAAIYWQAYALSQARRAQEAAAMVDRLRQQYPKSAWIDDAEALRIAADEDREQRKPREPRDEREADALMALDALLAGGNSKAAPILQRVLAGTYSDKVKGRAIFVLSQIDPAAADAALDAILRGNASSKLKAEAIHMIAAGGRRDSLDRLLPIYRESTDRAVRRGVLDAFLIGNRGDLMAQVIETEADADTREEAIEKLGAMGRRKELVALYSTRKVAGDREAVLRGLGIAGGRKELLEIARAETDPELKAEAIRSVGIAGGKDAGAALVEMYRADQPERVRKAVAEGLMIMGASRELVQLYRKETDPDAKRELLQLISATDSDAALEIIDETLR